MAKPLFQDEDLDMQELRVNSNYAKRFEVGAPLAWRRPACL